MLILSMVTFRLSLSGNANLDPGVQIIFKFWNFVMIT